MSEIQYDWKKIESVTMKANFIHFWCVESEFIVKNQFHNWTSELGCIWHIFGKLCYFWLFLENPDIQVNVNITVNKAAAAAAAGWCQCWSAWKEPNFPKMCQMHPNSDIQLWNLFLTINSDSTHQKGMKFAFIVTGSTFSAMI